MKKIKNTNSLFIFQMQKQWLHTVLLSLVRVGNYDVIINIALCKTSCFCISSTLDITKKDINEPDSTLDLKAFCTTGPLLVPWQTSINC